MKKTAEVNEVKLLSIAIIGKFSDDVYRQVWIKDETQNAVLSCIVACENEIKVLDNKIDGITF